MGNVHPRAAALSAVLGMALSGCALDVLNRWDGSVVRSQVVAAPAEDLWERLTGEIPGSGLLVAGVDGREKTIIFSWITAPGDGRQYLDCGRNAVGSASLRPRVALVPMGAKTRVEVSSLTRATAASQCASTGVLEEWLLARIGMPPASPLAATAPVLAK